MGVMAVVGLVVLLQASADTWFMVDDWAFLEQAGDRRRLLDNYNDHFSVVILTVYRLLGTVFGLSFLPFRVFSALAVVAVALAYYREPGGHWDRRLRAR